MHIALSRKGIAVAVAVGLVTAGAVTTVSYAAGSAKTVSACATKKGQLGLLSKKGKCGKGYSKVAIAKQGPRGATGPRGLRGLTGAAGKAGAAGQQGPAGPGTVSTSPGYFGSGFDTTTVDGIDYTTGCQVSGGSGNSRDVVASISISAKDNESMYLDGVKFTGTSPDVLHQTSPSVGDGLETTNSTPATARYPSVVVRHGNQSQLMTLRMNSFPSNTVLPIALRCDFDLVVTRAG